MLNLVESAASKEDAKVEKKLAKKAHVAKIIEEKDAKKDLKAEEKKDKLEKVKQAYLEAQKKKKSEARKQKGKARAQAAREKNQPAVSHTLIFYIQRLNSLLFRHLKRRRLDFYKLINKNPLSLRNQILIVCNTIGTILCQFFVLLAPNKKINKKLYIYLS